jgi:ClpP class serine protease
MRFEPWAISAAGYAAAAEVVARASNGGLKAMEIEVESFVNQRPPMSIASGVATIHVLGTLLSKSTPIERSCGITDYAQIREELSTAIASPDCKSINLVIDSPGGMVQGCTETGSAIRAASMTKRVTASVDGQCCSAAYWLASQSESIEATPSSCIGSIGVIMPWIDKVGMWEQFGIVWNPITSDGADLKGMGGGPELTQEQRDFLTASADRSADAFWTAIEEVRGPMPEELRRAGFYESAVAIQLRLIDTITKP